MADDGNPSIKFCSAIVSLSDEESNSSEEGDEEEVDSDEDWSPTEDILLSEKLRKDQRLDKEGFDDPLRGLKAELCTECGSFYTRKPHICRHIKKPFLCNMCGKRCVSKIALKSHSKIHREVYEYSCQYCYATFRKKGDKLEHEQTHQGIEKPYNCPRCPEVFASSKERSAHLPLHRIRKAVNCEVCGVKCCDLNRLQRHLLVHTGLKPYKCTVCQRGFNQASNLKSHMRVHTGEKPFKCQYCSKCFNHNVSLKSHVQRYHTEKAGINQNKGKRQKVDNNGGAAEDNGYTKDLDFEFDNEKEKQNAEQTVHRRSPGTSKDKNEKRGSGRSRGRPKSTAAGDSILAEVKNSYNNKTTKLKSQKLEKSVLSDEESERYCGRTKGDQEEGNE